MDRIIVAHGVKPVAERIGKGLLQLVVAAHYARQRAAAAQELQRMLSAEQIDIFALRRWIIEA
jgi:hypothetical protein